MTNPYEDAARTRKASALAQQARVDAQALHFPEGENPLTDWSDEDWRLLAERAGVNPPSQQTKDMVVDWLTWKPVPPPSAAEQAELDRLFDRL